MEQERIPFSLQSVQEMAKELNQMGYVVVKREQWERLKKIEADIREYALNLQQMSRQGHDVYDSQTSHEAILRLERGGEINPHLGSPINP